MAPPQQGQLLSSTSTRTRPAAGGPAGRPGCADRARGGRGALLLAASSSCAASAAAAACSRSSRPSWSWSGSSFSERRPNRPRCSCRIKSRSFSISACATSCCSRTRSRSVRAASRSARTVSCSACKRCQRSVLPGDDFRHMLQCRQQPSGSRGRSSSTSAMALFYWPKAERPGLPLSRPCSAAGPGGAGAGATAGPRAGSRAARRSGAPRPPPARASRTVRPPASSRTRPSCHHDTSVEQVGPGGRKGFGVRNLYLAGGIRCGRAWRRCLSWSMASCSRTSQRSWWTAVVLRALSRPVCSQR